MAHPGYHGFVSVTPAQANISNLHIEVGSIMAVCIWQEKTRIVCGPELEYSVQETVEEVMSKIVEAR